MNDLEAVLASPLLQRLGWALLAFVWQGALVAVLLGIVNSVWGRDHAGGTLPHAPPSPRCSSFPSSLSRASSPGTRPAVPGR